MKRAARVGAVTLGLAVGYFSRSPPAQAEEADAPHAPPGLDGYSLAQVHALFRHGARAPLSTKHGSGEEAVASCGRSVEAALRVLVRGLDGASLPAVSKGNARQKAVTLPGGCHLGQLSDVGWAQAEALGAVLRERYAQRLGLEASALSPAVSVRSSNLQRTVATAEGVLRGLFPQAPPDKPLATVLVATDAAEWLFPNTDACARLRRLWRGEGGASRPVVSDAELRAAHPEQLARLEAVLPQAERDALNKGLAWGLVELLDHAASRAAHGKAALGSMGASELSDLRALAAHVVAAMFVSPAAGKDQSTEALRLSMGRLLHNIVAELSAAAGHASPLRLSLSASHDTTVLPLLLALRGGESTAWLTWPPFASCISIELWAPPPAAGDAAPLAPHFVRVLYDQRVLPLPCAAGPHGACRLSDFASSLQRLIPVDYAAECH